MLKIERVSLQTKLCKQSLLPISNLFLKANLAQKLQSPKFAVPNWFWQHHFDGAEIFFKTEMPAREAECGGFQAHLPSPICDDIQGILGRQISSLGPSSKPTYRQEVELNNLVWEQKYQKQEKNNLALFLFCELNFKLVRAVFLFNFEAVQPRVDVFMTLAFDFRC